eukprot:TRINITY_DN51168_c0_g1_i1.p1 TRINITY_DN51168_c0_g1~~TRINITY_DN51168_c0_g1_i1.p1  ORF type:complete len:332 (+),score=52.06 TRINITY_DN51168_c0_g1_i1:69-1064(+)
MLRPKAIHFRDDLSEHSGLSNWGDRPGPLSLADHRIVGEGLQARRTAGEALMLARLERQRSADTESCSRCVGGRVAKACVEVFRGSIPNRPAMVFTWAEVQSIILLPCESETKGPFLIAVSSFRLQEHLLQAGSARSRARWAVNMMTSILKDRHSSREALSGGLGRSKGCNCYGAGNAMQLPTVLFMDMMRIACEAARLRPSVEGIKRLVEALELLSDSHWPGLKGMNAGSTGSSDLVIGQYPAVPHFPLMALRRFAEAARRAQEDFAEWQRWREVTKLVHPPKGFDEELWRSRILSFVRPQGEAADSASYPSSVESQLITAAERCRRTLS